MADDLDGIMRLLQRQREDLKKDAERAATHSSADDLLKKLLELRQRAEALGSNTEEERTDSK
jgi:hypothetical protein